jgi:hypothetical protein
MTESSTTLAHTLFGVSRGLEADERAAIRAYLRAAWQAQYGRPPSTLSVDLEVLGDLFRSHVQAKRLRAAAEQLRVITERRPLLPEAVFVPVDEKRGFLTPEGRVLLDELERTDEHAEQVLTRDDLLTASALIAYFYGSRQRQWMRKELAGGDVRPGTLGFAVFLLINNSVGMRRALLLPSAQGEEEALAGRVLPVINAFTIAVGGSPVKPRERERLRSNWIITEAKRQMGRYISRADDDRTVRFWIEAERENDLIDELGRQLARRKALTAAAVSDALDGTLSEYDHARPMLTSWGLAHERATHTRQLFDALVSAYTRATTA